MRGVQQLLDAGVPARDDWIIHLAGTPLTPMQRVWQVLNEIDILNRYPNYQLALVDDVNSDDNDPVVQYMNQNEWVVKGKGTIFLETWDYDSQGRITQDRFKSTEVREVARHREYFLALWHDKTKVINDRREVCAWLQGQIMRAFQEFHKSTGLQ